MKTFSSKEIIERLKIGLELSSDNALADTLGVSKTTLSNWKSRNSLDFPLVFSLCEQISLDWLLTGKGNMLKGVVEQPPSPQQSNEKEPTQLLNQLLDTIKGQAEEIGQLKEQVRQLTIEKERLASNAHSSHAANVG